MVWPAGDRLTPSGMMTSLPAVPSGEASIDWGYADLQQQLYLSVVMYPLMELCTETNYTQMYCVRVHSFYIMTTWGKSKKQVVMSHKCLQVLSL